MRCVMRSANTLLKRAPRMCAVWQREMVVAFYLYADLHFGRRQVADLAGVALPVAAVKHPYMYVRITEVKITTTPIPHVHSSFCSLSPPPLCLFFLFFVTHISML